jgi:hypothetical protein
MQTERIDQRIAQMIEKAALPLGAQTRERALRAMAACRLELREGWPALGAGERGRRARLIACAALAVAVMAGAAAVLVPRREREPARPGAQSVLTRGGQTAPQTRFIHIVSRVMASPTQAPGGARPVAIRNEVWLSPRACYARNLTPNGTVIRQGGVNLDDGKAWVYERLSKTLYVAGLKLVLPEISEAVGKNFARVVSVLERGRLRPDRAAGLYVELDAPIPVELTKPPTVEGMQTAQATAAVEKRGGTLYVTLRSGAFVTDLMRVLSAE